MILLYFPRVSSPNGVSLCLLLSAAKRYLVRDVIDNGRIPLDFSIRTIGKEKL